MPAVISILYPVDSVRGSPSTLPTLLPYTTLFRSRRYPAHLRQREGRRHRAHYGGNAASHHGRQRCGLSVRSAGTGWERADRKSTRLNSSHLVISYSVFCLKKKKTKATKAIQNVSI